MAQTTAAVPMNKFQVQLSIDGSSWVDKSGSTVDIKVTGQEQMSGAQNTADGFAPVVTGNGKHSAVTITARGVYTKTSGEFWDYIRDRWEDTSGANRTVYIRWAPEGGIGSVVGNEQFTATTDAGTAFASIIKNINSPDLDAGNGGPALVTAVLECPKVTRALTATT
jgi:hypothetical protein